MINLVVFAVTIVVLVGLHEAGHFAAAKAFHVYVIEFAIGFGPRIASWKGKETRYSIRAIPFGGYVRMAGEDGVGTDLDIPADRFLYAKPPWARAIISVVAPLVNILLALLVSVLIMWATAFPVLQVAELIPGTPAAETLAFGDQILSIDGTNIYTNDHISRAVQRAAGAPVTISLVRDGEPMQLTVTPEHAEAEDRYILGAYFSAAAYTNELAEVDPESPLAASGLRAGDRIVAVEDTGVETGVGLLLALDAKLPADRLDWTVLRNGSLVVLSVPATGRTADDLIADVSLSHEDFRLRSAGFVDGITLGVTQFAGYVQMMAEVVRGIFGGEIAASEALQGPVGVAQTLGEGLRLGWGVFFQLFAFLSLNFGLINLIPFPAFDGSRVAFALIEWVRGKPIAPEREGMIHAVGFIILIGLLILVTYQDILRLFR